MEYSLYVQYSVHKVLAGRRGRRRARARDPRDGPPTPASLLDRDAFRYVRRQGLSSLWACGVGGRPRPVPTALLKLMAQQQAARRRPARTSSGGGAG